MEKDINFNTVIEGGVERENRGSVENNANIQNNWFIHFKKSDKKSDIKNVLDNSKMEKDTNFNLLIEEEVGSQGGFVNLIVI